MNTRGKSKGRPRAIVAVVVLTLIAAACGNDETSSQPSATTTTQTSDATGGRTTITEAGASAPGSVDLPTERDTEVQAVTYNLGVIGLPHVTFDVGDGWFFTHVGEVSEGLPLSEHLVMISAAATAVPGRRNVQFSRPSHLVDPTFIGPPRPSVIDPDEDLESVEGIEGWLTAAEEGGEWGVGDVESIEVSGHAATRFTLRPDFVGCEGMEALAPGVSGDWTLCNGAIAWDLDSDDGQGQIAVEGWDGGQNEYLWIHDVGGAPLVVGIHLGYDFDEEWNERARAVMSSVNVV